MNYIEVDTIPTKEYQVQVAYYNIDSHDDKPSFDKPDVWCINVKATSNVHAIEEAMKIVTICRAETMTSFMGDERIHDGQTSFTIDEIEKIRQHAEDHGVFKSWLLVEPTSIQCTLRADVDKLKDMTIRNLNQEITSISDEVEDYLKEGDKNA